MKDILKGVLTHYEGTLKCSTAWVCPPFLEESLLLYNVPLKLGYVKCYVTEVKPRFNEFALKNVLGDFMSKGPWEKHCYITSSGHERK